MKYAYFAGCSAYSTARDMHESTMSVAEALDIEFIEPDGWTCCGATAAHQTDRLLAVALPAVNLVRAQEMNMDLVASCAACYSRLKKANHEIVTSPDMRRSVKEMLSHDYDGSVPVRHFMEILLEDVGLDSIKTRLKTTLNGLRVACYYGCLLVRPHEVMQFDDPENPTSLDRIINVMGGESLDWPHKVECCGGSLSLTKTDVVIDLADSIIGMARDAGADCIAVACPMCQTNLDLRQLDIARVKGKKYNMPIMYITQLIGLCLGVPPKNLGLNRLVVSPDPVLKVLGANV
jgi:heterodisulfide reductase subunit B2